MTAPRPFLFGKLPAHGDFVARGLSPEEQAAWDAWASAGLEQAREALGDSFEDAHDTAPPWRFVSRADGGWRAGSLACSVDSTGRRFVLVLGVADLSAEHASTLGVRDAELIEAVLYDALASRAAADDAVLALAGAVAPDPTLLTAAEALACAPRGPGVWWTLGGERHPPLVFTAGEPPADLLLRVLQSSSQLEMAS
jgi:type VI secretion system protein ImpM